MNSVCLTAVFAGDSITDAGCRDDPDHLGTGYVRDIAEREANLLVVNAGISGDRVIDLRRRWTTDVLAHRPDILTVLIGVNDMWRRYDSGDPTSAEVFAEMYDGILGAATAAGVGSLILMEPFLVPVDDEQLTWHADDLDEKIGVARSLARRYGALLVPLDRVMNAAAVSRSAVEIALDGVHPTPLGHRIIADQWREAAAALVSGQDVARGES